MRVFLVEFDQSEQRISKQLTLHYAVGYAYWQTTSFSQTQAKSGCDIAQVYINNCPTRCNTKQSSYYSAISLYMFRVSTTPTIRSTQNCNYSLRHWSYFLCQVGHIGCR